MPNVYEKLIKVKYFDPEMERIQKYQKGDWIDLRSAETVELDEGDDYRLRLGIGMILPDGYEAIIAPRSSTYKNFGIIVTNSIGVIDNSYRGDDDEWQLPVHAMRDTIIHKNDRICQFRIQKKMPKITFEETDHLASVNRGGFGSTGIN